MPSTCRGPDGALDVAWTQQVSMNIADKPRFYAELRRVLRPGGRLAFFDLLAGPVQPIHFPVPGPMTRPPARWRGWRRPASSSPTPVRHRALEDTSVDARAFFEAPAAGPPPDRHVGLQLVIPDMPAKAANLRRNVDEDRLALVRCVATAT